MINDNFKDFELDSTDVIRNLQIVFLFFFILLVLPIVMLLLFSLFSWNAKCKKWLTLAAKSIFWNTYVRFWLESYLEFSIAIFIRFRKFTFGSASEIFNSVFATFIAVTLIMLMIGSVVVLQCRT